MTYVNAQCSAEVSTKYKHFCAIHDDEDVDAIMVWKLQTPITCTCCVPLNDNGKCSKCGLTT